MTRWLKGAVPIKFVACNELERGATYARKARMASRRAASGGADRRVDLAPGYPVCPQKYLRRISARVLGGDRRREGRSMSPGWVGAVVPRSGTTLDGTTEPGQKCVGLWPQSRSWRPGVTSTTVLRACGAIVGSSPEKDALNGCR